MGCESVQRRRTASWRPSKPPTRTGSASACSGTPKRRPRRPSTCRSLKRSCRPVCGRPSRSRWRPEMAERWIIGVASGSGAEAVQASLLEISGLGLELHARVDQSVRSPLSRELRELLLRVSGGTPCEARHAAQTHRLLGETYAAAARQVAERASLPLQRVHCLGCLGHAVAHDPDGRFPASQQLGMAAIVAERTGITTLSDFLDRDLAAGGQGVPLHALADYL